MSILQAIKDNPWVVALFVALILYTILHFYRLRSLKKHEEERKARLRVLTNPPGGHLIKHPVTQVISFPNDKKPYSPPSVRTSQKKDTSAEFDDGLSAPVVDLFRNTSFPTPPTDDYSSSHHSSSHSSHDYGGHSSHDSSSSSHDSSSHDSGGGWDSGGGGDSDGGSFGD